MEQGPLAFLDAIESIRDISHLLDEELVQPHGALDSAFASSTPSRVLALD